MSKIFLDTNILIYAMDRNDPGKLTQSRELLKKVSAEHSPVISTQVMQEFFVAATRKLAADPLLVKDILHSFAGFETVVVSPGLIKEAIDCSIINRLSFWDALIVVSAESASCEILWTEDLNHGQILRGLRVENPYRGEGS